MTSDGEPGREKKSCVRVNLTSSAYRNTSFAYCTNQYLKIIFKNRIMCTLLMVYELRDEINLFNTRIKK